MTSSDMPIDISRLPSGAKDAVRHWREHRPTMFAELLRDGKLIEQAIAADEATDADQYDLMIALIGQGHPSPVAFDMAREIVRERYIYLPTEEDVPQLMQTDAGLYRYELPAEPETGVDPP